MKQTGWIDFWRDLVKLHIRWSRWAKKNVIDELRGRMFGQFWAQSRLAFLQVRGRQCQRVDKNKGLETYVEGWTNQPPVVVMIDWSALSKREHETEPPAAVIYISIWRKDTRTYWQWGI